MQFQSSLQIQELAEKLAKEMIAKQKEEELRAAAVFTSGRNDVHMNSAA